MASDSRMLRQGIASISDFQRLQDEFDLKKQLASAELKKAGQIDVDKLGERAFMKAAMGEPLSKEEQAAAMFIDAKSGGISMNPVTGEIIQRPRISEKIGLPGMAKGQQPVNYSNNADSVYVGELGPFPTITPEQMTQKMPPMGDIPFPSPPSGAMRSGLSPRAEVDFQKENIAADRKRLDEAKASASSARTLANTNKRMVELLPDVGYTGVGAGPIGFADKLMTGLGAPNVIPGTPEAREAFASQSVQQWVSSVEPLKGALTEREGARFDQAVNSLTTTPAGIKLRAEITQRLQKRAEDRADFYEQWYQQNGNLLGADEIWRQYADQSPVIDDDLLARVRAVSGSAGAAPNENLDAIDAELRRRGVQ